MAISRLNEEFEKVVCINLLERPDKRKKMQKRFDDNRIEVEWFNSVKFNFLPNISNSISNNENAHFNRDKPYEIGASLAHYHVIKQALLEGRNSIFVFEDDAKLHINFDDKLDSYFESIPEKWDIILFYSFMYNLGPKNVRVSKRWVSSNKSWSLLSYGMKRDTMEAYIERQDRYFTIADLVTYHMQEDNGFNIYSAVPCLCIPDTDLGSDIRGESMNYKHNPTVLNMGYSDDNYE